MLLLSSARQPNGSSGQIVTVASALLLLLSSPSSLFRGSLPPSTSTTSSSFFCHALRHNFHTKDDHRTFIGPLGFPFGFLETGHYNLTVYDFELSAPVGPHDHDGVPNNNRHHKKRILTTTTDHIESAYDEIKGVGFLLKPFRDEAMFNRYMAWVQSDPSRCVFQKYLNRTDEDGDGAYITDDHSWFDEGNDLYPGGGDGLQDDDGGGAIGDDVDDDNRIIRRRRQQQQQQNRRRRARVLADGEDVDSPDGVGESTDSITDGLFLDMMPRDRWGHHHPSAVYDFKAGQGGFYFLMYQICFKDGVNISTSHLPDIHSKFELDFHFSNRDVFGKVSYLSAGEMVLPHLFFLFSILYGICLYLWIGNIRLIREGKAGYFDTGVPPESAALAATPVGRGVQAPTVAIYPIHYLMGFLLVLKTLSLFFESIRYHYLRVTGNAVFWSAVYYTFAFLKGITLFTVILLIGSGWSFVKPFLSDRERNVILAILVLQVINNIAIVVLTQETEGENGFKKWMAVLHMVDILCCCAVLIPIVWNVNQLEKNMQQNQHDDADENGQDQVTLYDVDEFEDENITEDELEAIPINGSNGHHRSVPATPRPPDERLVAKLKLFRSFYILVLMYIYSTRIVIYLFAANLNYRHTWIRYFVFEAVTILFYCTVGMLFRPMNENPYLHLRRRVAGGGRSTQVEMRKIDPKSKAVID